MIAEVIIQSNVKNLDKVFDYNVPDELKEKVKIGARVFVPFGNLKNLETGFVIGIKESSEYDVKDIASIQEEDILNENRINLAKYMARRYFCNLSDCLKLMLPPGTVTKKVENRAKAKSINFVCLKKEQEEIEEAIETGKIKSEKQIRALNFIVDNGESLISDLEMFADVSRAVVNTLCKNGYLEIVERKAYRNPFENKHIAKTEKLKLTDEQQHAYDSICESMEDKLFSEFLIYGVTGSRKNRNLFAINRKGIKRGKD